MGIGGELVGDLEQLLVSRTLRRRTLFRFHPASQSWRAEKEIEETYPGAQCLLLPSATLGLAMLLDVLAIERGREVLIPPFGWVSNWSCIRRAGLVPRFLPLDDQLQIRATAVEERLSDQTGAVIVPHLLGRGQQEIRAIASLCAARGVPLLEDIAQSFGVSVTGQRAGTFGVGSWCSLNHHKILSTGDGGFVLVRDPALFERLSARHDQGNTIRDGKRRPASTIEPGLSLRVSELVSSVLRAQLARYHLVRTRIHALHEVVANACQTRLGLELIPPHPGDIPFTVFFRRPGAGEYPTLATAGWHVAANVPWLSEDFARAARADAELVETMERLNTVCAVGAGFIDRYHGIELGLGITDPPSTVDALIRQLEAKL